MKAYRLVWLLLTSSLALAQAAPAPAKTAGPAMAPGAPAKQTAAPQAQPATAAELPPQTVVLTIEGLCKSKDPKTGECKTVVTRAEFDKLLNVLVSVRPGPPQAVPLQAKRQLATQYERMLVFAAAAQKQGLENTPDTRELLQFVRLEVLEAQMRHALQQKAQPTPEEVLKYYDDNHDRYTELTLQRIMIPLHVSTEAKASEEDLKKLAEDIRQRSLAGGEFKALQAEAAQKSGLQNPPETKMVVKPAALPPTHAAALQLKPGEVSQVIQDPAGLYIYKLDERRPIPLDQVKTEIQYQLSQQKFQQETEALMKSANPTYNQEYFGPTGPPPGMVMPPAAAGKPGVQGGPTPAVAAPAPVPGTPPSKVQAPGTSPAPTQPK